jgi:heme/copper-type cytochrome/quinol oxidase subunit 2
MFFVAVFAGNYYLLYDSPNQKAAAVEYFIIFSLNCKTKVVSKMHFPGDTKVHLHLHHAQVDVIAFFLLMNITTARILYSSV